MAKVKKKKPQEEELVIKDERWLNKGELAKALGVSRPTLREILYKVKPPEYLINNLTKYYLSDVKKAIQEYDKSKNKKDRASLSRRKKQTGRKKKTTFKF